MSSRPVLVCAALSYECRAVLNILDERRGATPRWHGRIGTVDVVVQQTGVGLAAARRSGEKTLREVQPSCLVSTGFAGGLSPQVGLGDAIAPDHVSLEHGDSIPVDGRLRALVAPLLPEKRSRRGLLVSARLPARTPGEKAALARRLRADAVDMESAALLDLARAAGVAAVVVRAASDTASDSLPDLTGLDVERFAGQLRLVGRAARSPRMLRELATLARGGRAATQTLRDVLGKFLPLLQS